MFEALKTVFLCDWGGGARLGLRVSVQGCEIRFSTLKQLEGHSQLEQPSETFINRKSNIHLLISQNLVEIDGELTDLRLNENLKLVLFGSCYASLGRLTLFSVQYQDIYACSICCAIVHSFTTLVR